MSNPPSLFEMWMTGWMKMVMSPWQSDVNIEEPVPSAVSDSMFEYIDDVTFKKISNYDYERLSVENKKRLIEEYRMISLDDPFFYGYWMLIPQDGAIALRDEIDRDIVSTIIRESEEKSKKRRENPFEEA